MKIYITHRTNITEDVVTAELEKYFCNSIYEYMNVSITTDFCCVEPSRCMCFSIAQLTSMQTILQKLLNTKDTIGIF